MGHDYGVPLRFLAMTPTRDNGAAPGDRMPDKHSRLFCGKTLDEWCALQVWSSKHLGRHVFIAETEAHAEKLQYLRERYGVTIWVRPKDMLHPLNDGGGVPLVWATRKALDEEWFTLVTDAFVISPCRPPGFFDMMVDLYAKTLSRPDNEPGQQWIIGGSVFQGAVYELDDRNIGHQLGQGEGYLGENPRWRMSNLQHLMALSHWWVAYYVGVAGRIDVSIKPYFFDIPEWQDVHIDTEDQWRLAEWYFKTKILDVYGEDGYEQYRRKNVGVGQSDVETHSGVVDLPELQRQRGKG